GLARRPAACPAGRPRHPGRIRASGSSALEAPADAARASLLTRGRAHGRGQAATLLAAPRPRSAEQIGLRRRRRRITSLPAPRTIQPVSTPRGGRTGRLVDAQFSDAAVYPPATAAV